MRMIVSALVCLSVLMLPAISSAADWPQYRADPQRSGYTAEQLPVELHLQWTYVAPHPPQPAWPDVYWQRQTYDLAYQPVVARGMLFYGSSADCKVYALDAATGRLEWSFFTDGPVRFAPAAWRDRMFAISDDGHLYCLAASDGSLLWKKRGGIESSRILGNGRMVSRCPARGGPVIQDDVLYFGAGVFPSHGFFLHAVDPETSETLWLNDTSGNLRQNHVTGYTLSNKVGNAAQQIRVREHPTNVERMIEAAASPTQIFVATGRRIKAIDRGHPLDEHSDIWGQTEGLYFRLFSRIRG